MNNLFSLFTIRMLASSIVIADDGAASKTRMVVLTGIDGDSRDFSSKAGSHRPSTFNSEK
ncbi:hypothetical protein RISK_000851 [Rhodopirellula islandica]|uniref:Signal peptide and transmembrane protein n=1 Tax=Rhodopirellula islandica TaxID=595434 RepID=A0A0J1BKI7_RHOIS|nr:hypothetical protein [Rhodopirellula islandica]KLU07050.1 hypothetical protein RISK_000851 [Rhodopirellula islandica]